MKNFTLAVVCAAAAILSACAGRSAATSGNPVFEGWYADPEGAVFEGEYWI